MTATMSERDKELSLVQHLGELRTRLMVAAFAVLITSVIAFLFSTSIIRVLLIPVDCQWFEVTTRSLFPPDISARLGLTCSALPTKLVALSPTENFTTFMRVSLFAGIAIAMPVILYEIYAYIDPALLAKERRYIRFMGLPVILLFVLGMAFCYFVLLPNAIKFLISFGGDVIQNQLRASDYISFVTTFILGVGLVFEMPAIIYALVRVHVVRRSWLAQQRRRGPQVERHGVGPRLGEVMRQLAEAALERIGLRGERAVHGRLGERVVRLRQADEVRRLLRRARDHERLRIGEAHVLAGEDDDAPRDEHGVLSSVDHPHEPVESGVGVGATHALDEGADRVVVLVARAVVEQRSALERLADLLEPHRPLAVGPRRGRIGRKLERVQGDARVAVAHGDEPVLRVLGEPHAAAEAALVREGAAHDGPHVLFAERPEREHARI